jgi:hypothetical protein
MKTLQASWKRSLVAGVLLLGLGPERDPTAAAEKAQGGRSAAPAKQAAPSAKAGVAVEDTLPQRPLRTNPPPIARDRTVKYDYDIVYVRAPRVVKGPDGKVRQAHVWPNAADPTDLMLLHPDGNEEVLVAGGKGAVADPYVSFDAKWVYYSYFHDTSGRGGADVYKVHVPTRKVVRLTQQRWTPNTGAAPVAAWYGDRASGRHNVYNMHPCPLPGGRVAFVSDRDGLKAPRGAQRSIQLFVMDDDGANVEKIGHLNVGQALHPVILKDSRIIFSSLEMQGRHNTGWGILGIRPDGTHWEPVVSALGMGGAPIPFHFQTQLSDESIVVENDYIPAMGGFGVYFKQPARAPEGVPPFGPARPRDDPKMRMMHFVFHMPFQPHGMEVLTRFTQNLDHAGLRANPKDPNSPHAGWLTHPCGAPDNHLLTVWSGMMPPNQGRIIDHYDNPPLNSGIYLIKGGRPLWDPGDMLLVKNDPNYNEQWPRPLVPYRRIYGVDEPARLPPLRNDGKLSKHLPEGTPFGLVGTSSLYKRESYPLGGKSPRYIWPMQSRTSPLTWRLFGRRTDGFPAKMVAGAEADHQGLLNRGGEPYRPFKGSIMPPPDAVAGTYVGPDGKKVKVAPLTDEDRRTLLRWIDLGCPIDHDFDAARPGQRGRGWMLDDQRPTLTLTYPRVGVNGPLTRIVVGMYDYDSGLDPETFTVTADFVVDGLKPGTNLAGRFKALPGSRWELNPQRPVTVLPRGLLTVAVRDRQGNVSRIERTFTVTAAAQP